MNQDLKNAIDFLCKELDGISAASKEDLQEELITFSMCMDTNDDQLSSAIKKIAKDYLGVDVADEKIQNFTEKNALDFLKSTPKTLHELTIAEKSRPMNEKITPYVMRTFQQYAYAVLKEDGRVTQHRTVTVNNFFEWIRERMNQHDWGNFVFSDKKEILI